MFWARLDHTLSEGLPLSQGLQNTSLKNISSISISLVSLAEETGKLSIILQLLSQWLRDQGSIQQRLTKPLRYPLIVLSITVVMLLVMMVKIVPIFSALYGEGTQELPHITLYLFSVSKWLIDSPVLATGLLIALVITGVQGWLTRAKWSYRIPAFGHLVTSSERIIMLKTMALAYECGLPVEKILSLMANNSRCLSLSKVLLQLKEGHPLSQLMMQHSELRPQSIAVISNGEKTGLLSETLNQAANIEQQYMERWLTRMELYMEPLLMVGLSVILGTIILALYLPIFDLGQSL